MGQKVNPKGFRLGVSRDWDAHWFARDSYGQQALEDINLRMRIGKILEGIEVGRVEIERAGNDSVRVKIYTPYPGKVIGKKGQDIEILRKQLAAASGRKAIEVSVQEIKTPELDAAIVAKSIALQLEKRASFKQVLKKAAASAVRGGAQGVRIKCSGRLGGAEIARTEGIHLGSVPLHTLRSDIDYGFAEAKTTYGMIGVKVWICKGESH